MAGCVCQYKVPKSCKDGVQTNAHVARPAVQNKALNVQKSGAEDEAEQVLDVLMSKGATEAALTDEMGRLRVQEEVTCSLHAHWS